MRTTASTFMAHRECEAPAEPRESRIDEVPDNAPDEVWEGEPPPVASDVARRAGEVLPDRRLPIGQE